MESCVDVSSGLDLTIAMPGFSSSSLLSSGESGGTKMRVADININQLPSFEEEEEEEEEEESPQGGGPGPRKKLRLTKDQSRLLEQSFIQNHTLNPREKEALAQMLRLKPRQVEVWFQNRRARSKLKQTEMECEYLKRWFGSLSEQNRKLHKEVEELRAIKVGAHLSPPQPAALTMCPHCERLTTTTAAMPQLRHRQHSSAACYN